MVKTWEIIFCGEGGGPLCFRMRDMANTNIEYKLSYRAAGWDRVKPRPLLNFQYKDDWGPIRVPHGTEFEVEKLDKAGGKIALSVDSQNRKLCDLYVSAFDKIARDSGGGISSIEYFNASVQSGEIHNLFGIFGTQSEGFWSFDGQTSSLIRL